MSINIATVVWNLYQLGVVVSDVDFEFFKNQYYLHNREDSNQIIFTLNDHIPSIKAPSATKQSHEEALHRAQELNVQN